MRTRTFFKIVAKNRNGHATVFVANNNIIDLIRVCFRAVIFYEWINLDITRVTERIDEPVDPRGWMKILQREKTPVIRSQAKEKFRIYVSIDQDDANKFAEFVGAQSITRRSDGAFDILVLSSGSYF